MTFKDSFTIIVIFPFSFKEDMCHKTNIANLLTMNHSFVRFKSLNKDPL